MLSLSSLMLLRTFPMLTTVPLLLRMLLRRPPLAMTRTPCIRTFPVVNRYTSENENSVGRVSGALGRRGVQLGLSPGPLEGHGPAPSSPPPVPPPLYHPDIASGSGLVRAAEAQPLVPGVIIPSEDELAPPAPVPHPPAVAPPAPGEDPLGTLPLGALAFLNEDRGRRY